MATGAGKPGKAGPSERAALHDWQRVLQADLAQASVPRQDMDSGARVALRELIADCERLLFGELAAIRGDDWYVEALAALCGASRRLRWAAWHPDELGDWPALVEAAKYLGRAQHAVSVGRSRRNKPGRALGSVDTKASFIVEELRAAPKASSSEIARRLQAHQVDPGHVRKVRGRLKRQK